MRAYKGYRWDSKKVWRDKLGNIRRGRYVKMQSKKWKKPQAKVKHLSRHKSEAILQSSYDKPQRAEVRDYANKTTSVLSFIKRRTA